MKIAVIGAGAAGCFAAANIPFSIDHEIIIFEKSARSLQKVKVSGGGRCNVTYACFEVSELIEKYPRGKQLLRKSLFRFGPQQTIEWFETRGVELKQEHDGRIFPVSNDSQSIINCLERNLAKNNIKVQYHKSVERIEKQQGVFTIFFADKTTYKADKILIAAGGFPKREQYQWIIGLGHSIENPVPSLFTFNMPNNAITEMMGVAVQDVSVKISGTKIVESGPLLITHWGLSGPVILRTSAWAARELANKNYNFSIQINWLDKTAENQLRDDIGLIRKTLGKQFIGHKNPFQLPKRFWEYLLRKNAIDEQIKWGDLSATLQNRLIESLVNDRYEIQGKTTFKEEFVTCGGIKLLEVNPNTMESRLVPGLFFAGEILDVDGITGGFNFQHAWSSAYVASQFITGI